MNETEVKKKRLAETHPCIYALLTVALSTLTAAVISYLVQSIGSIAAMAVKGSVTPEGLKNIAPVTSNLLTLLGGFVVLIIYFIVYRKEISPSFFSGEGTGKGIIMLWSMLAVNAVTFFFSLMDYEEFGSLPMALLSGLTPGITEEILCRIIPLSIVMRRWEREKLMLPSVLFSSLIFGLFHAVNIFSGADTTTTLFQILYSTGMGFLFGAIYIRTANIWIPIILHSLSDFIFFLRSGAQASGGVLSNSTDSLAGVILFVYAMLYFVNAYFVFKKYKAADAIERWNAVWNKKEK